MRRDLGRPAPVLLAAVAAACSDGPRGAGAGGAGGGDAGRDAPRSIFVEVPCDPSGGPFGCLEAYPDPRPPFAETIGVNTHYGRPREPFDPAAFDRLAEAGVRWIRNDLDWAEVETERGVYDFAAPGYDEIVAAAEERGLSILFILDFGNELYGPPKAVVDEAGRAAFAAYAGAAAERYGGRGHAWEIWNEPNLPVFWTGGGSRPDGADYSLLVDAAVPALRAADPEAEIAVGAVSYTPLAAFVGGTAGAAFVQALVDGGSLAGTDALTVHLYRGKPPEDARGDLEALGGVLERAELDLPVWSGEWGYSTYDPAAPPTGVNYLPAVGEETQASYVARMLLFDYELGLPRSIVFKDHDRRGGEPGNIEDHFGILDPEDSPKPAYDAVATLGELVGEATGTGTLSIGDGRHGLVFEGAAGRVLALWAERPTTFRLRSDDPGARIAARSGAGRTPEGLVPGAEVELRLGADEGPAYVLGGVHVVGAE